LAPRQGHGNGLALVGGDQQALVAVDRLAAFGISLGVAGELEVDGVAGGKELRPVAAVVHPRGGVLHLPCEEKVCGIGGEIDLGLEPAALVPGDAAGDRGLAGLLLRGDPAQVLALGGGDLRSGHGEPAFDALHLVEAC
jgi:hypothetical protein